MTIDELRALNDEKNNTKKHHGDPEHELQVKCVQYFRLKYPKELIFAIPNGGQRDIRVAKKLKEEGVVAGVPDMQVVSARNGYHGLFLELKNGKKGRLSDKQSAMIDFLTKKGYKCVIIRTLDDFIAETKEYFGC